MSWLHKMWAFISIPWNWELSLSSGISLFPWHVHIRFVLMPAKVKLWISKQVYKHGFCYSWQSIHAPLNKIHPPFKDKIFKILSFVNIMVIAEHHSMRLSSQVSFFWTGLFPTWLPPKAMKSLCCVALLEEIFFRSCGSHGFSSFFS